MKEMFASALGVPAMPPSPGGVHGVTLVGGWNAERGAVGNDAELPAGGEADSAAALLDTLTSEKVGSLLMFSELSASVPEENLPKVKEIIAALHSNGLVKGYHGGSAVPLNDASHLRFIIGGNETMIMEE